MNILSDLFRAYSKNLLIIALLFFAFAPTGMAHTDLNPGDIAFTGYQSDNPDMFSFVLLKNVEAGTSIHFTDHGWFAAGGFRNTEGVLRWTATGDLSCGTEILISDTPTANLGSVSEVDAGFSLAISGDQIFAYQGPQPKAGNEFAFISAIQMNGNWDADATSSNTSAIPSILTDGTNAISISPEVDNAVYNCAIISGGAIALGTAINNLVNWNTSNAAGLTFMPCTFSVTDNCDKTDPFIAGDIAFTGYQSDNPDLFSFVLLRNKPAGSVIYFTDNGWFGAGGFRDTEGIIALTFTEDLPCGTEVLVSLMGSSTGVLDTISSVPIQLATAGDQIFAYYGNPPINNTSDNFIAAIGMNGDWETDATSSNTSALPPLLIEGTNAVSIVPESDNAIYNCQNTMGTDALIRFSINNRDNWITSGTVGLGIPPDCGFFITEGCDTPVAIPTVGEWGILILMLAFLNIGILVLLGKKKLAAQRVKN